jgi:FtsP/CotA-like multicopper oxidase with cupredoxin domain
VGGNPAITPYLKGKAVPAPANEAGWKDTVRMMPGEVTRILVRYAPTDLPATTPKEQAYYPFDPNHGHGYVWHCHIVDHEDNEMMRPLSVQSNPCVDPKDREYKGDGIDY